MALAAGVSIVTDRMNDERINSERNCCFRDASGIEEEELYDDIPANSGFDSQPPTEENHPDEEIYEDLPDAVEPATATASSKSTAPQNTGGTSFPYAQAALRSPLSAPSVHL